MDKLEKAWRWFGDNDAVTLDHLVQMGIEGVVTALHHLPTGVMWPKDAIIRRKHRIEDKGMRWTAVESVPVSEDIKTAGSRRDEHIENYCKTIQNLGECGVDTVCYNFMPVLDWCRTILDYPHVGGGIGLCFDYPTFVAFDVFILKRPGAENDYSAEDLTEAEKVFAAMTPEQAETLCYNIIVATQGFINGNVKEGDLDPVGIFRGLLRQYDGISKDQLRENLRYFLDAVMPVCDEYGIDMCIHPDDPPMQVLGLPRIVTDAADIRWLLSAVDNPHNGLTFCAGSLSSGAHNDCVAMAREFAPRTRFVHLRSCDVFPNGDFQEAYHTAGRANLVELVRIFEKMDPALPMRVDHGRTMLGDEKRGYNPGYGFHGRMLALGQVEGMMAAVRRSWLS